MPDQNGAKIPYHERRWSNSETEKRLADSRIEMGLPPHVSPYSTFIAAMGNHWRPDCKMSVETAAHTAWEAGYGVTLAEIHDRCYQPYDGLGLMRNEAYMRAIEEGYEYILYLDNDVMLPKYALTKLLARHVPIVSPIVRYADGEAHGLTMPLMPENKGLALVTSCVLSCLLFRTAVFLPWATTPFWESPLGADEAYHFRRLALAGHRPFVDTDVVVTCADPPHYPLDQSVGRSVEDLDAFRGTAKA